MAFCVVAKSLVKKVAIRAIRERQNRRARNGRIIRRRGRIVRRDRVHRTLQVTRDSDLAIRDLHERLVEPAEEGDVHVAGGVGAVGVGDADGVAGLAVAEGERWEGLEGQGRVGVRAGHDEGAGEGVDLVEGEGGLER